jgi:ribose transport system substrate-binding protein
MVVALRAAKPAGIPVLTRDSDMLPENKDLRVA